MLRRLPVEENKDEEQCRRELDAQLKVKRWRITSEQVDPYEDSGSDPNAPWWWEGAEEASDSFLSAMGVTL